MRILLFGPPGVGKGTQAALLSTVLNLPHISSGDLFRHHIAGRTPLGIEAQSALDAGDLVPDHITQIMLADRLRESDCRNGFVLDGFPRTQPQAEWLDELLGGVSGLDAVVALTAPEHVLIQRVQGRGRPDDAAETVAHRLAIYHATTEPLLDHYRSLMVTIDADREVDAVLGDILNCVRLPASSQQGHDAAPGDDTITRLRRRAGLMVMGKANRSTAEGHVRG